MLCCCCLPSLPAPSSVALPVACTATLAGTAAAAAGAVPSAPGAAVRPALLPSSSLPLSGYSCVCSGQSHSPPLRAMTCMVAPAGLGCRHYSHRRLATADPGCGKAAGRLDAASWMQLACGILQLLLTTS